VKALVRLAGLGEKASPDALDFAPLGTYKSRPGVNGR
jgi:hypothetical protein